MRGFHANLLMLGERYSPTQPSSSNLLPTRQQWNSVSITWSARAGHFAAASVTVKVFVPMVIEPVSAVVLVFGATV